MKPRREPAESLRLENSRSPFDRGLKDLAASVRSQIEACLEYSDVSIDALFTATEPDDAGFGEMIIVDAIDPSSDAVLYQLYLFPYGDGVLFADGSTDVIANICQHGFDPVTPAPNLVDAMGLAWLEGSKRLGLWTGLIDFRRP